MFGNYINGEWITNGATFENRNPANNGEVVGTFVKGTADRCRGRRLSRLPGLEHQRAARGNILYKAAASWTEFQSMR
jgi:hypothetical protein